MTLSVSLKAEGLLDPAKLAAWTKSRRDKIWKGVGDGMRDARAPVVAAVRAQAAGVFNVKKSSWLKTFSAKIFDRRSDVLPVMDVYSRVPWMGIHEKGGTVKGPVLIPLNVGRMGRKAFKAMVQRLMASGNAFFQKIDGKVYLFAENVAENGRDLSRFRKAERQRTGHKKVKRGTELLIGILLPSVTLRRRLRLKDSARAQMPVIARAIEQRIARG